MYAYRKVFSEIEDLLEEYDRLKHNIDLMLTQGMANTISGSNFLIELMREKRDIILALAAYPNEWINAVRIIISLRSK